MKKKLEADENPLITELDWNFDNVPDDELAACCLWEFARESKSFAVSSARKVEREESFGRQQRPNRKPNPDYEAFLESYWNCDEGYMEYYETIRNYGGPDTLPWQLISADLRQRLKKQVGVHELGGPLVPAMLRQLETLWKGNLKEWETVRNQPGYDSGEDGIAYDA